MWAGIQADPQRMKLLFSDRYYVKDFSSGAPPLPYRAYLRIRVAWRGEGKDRVLVVSRQRVHPLQKDGDWVDWYHGVEFSEEELVFDENWRFRSEKRWVWGVPSMSGPEEKPPEKLVYGVYPSRPGHMEIRREGDKVSVVQENKVVKTWPAVEDVPSWEAGEVLLPVAADLVKGAAIYCSYGGGRGAGRKAEPDYRLVAGSIDGPNGEPVPVGEVKDGGRYFIPRRAEFGSSGNQCTTQYTRTSADVYRKAFHELLKDFRIESLTDKKGRPVELPLGLQR